LGGSICGAISSEPITYGYGGKPGSKVVSPLSQARNKECTPGERAK